MTRKEFLNALRSARDVYVQVPCTGGLTSVSRGMADDCQIFKISKSEARRVLGPLSDDTHVLAEMINGDLYIN